MLAPRTSCAGYWFTNASSRIHMTSNSANLPLPPSLWAATASPAPALVPLSASRTADIAIIGGGFTGLSMALHLAERGADVCLLDASEPGWGASGRNGGMVIPGLKYDPDELVHKFGPDRAERIVAAVGNAADLVFELIEKHKIECDTVRKGWIQPAHSAAGLKALARRAAQWAERGARVEVLDRDAVAQRVGTDAYAGGWVDYRAGSVQPLSYSRGLARAALAAGAALHRGSPAVDMTRQGNRWQLVTASGAQVSAEHVVLATNGYTGDLWPRLQQSVIAANSFMVATKPLPDAMIGKILANGEVASDARRLLLYYRRDAHNRFLMGGRGPFAEPKGPQDFRHLERALALLFPQLAGVEYEFRWSGRIAITRDFLPHVHEPAPGLSIFVGCNGRGIALCTMMGAQMARKLLGVPASEFPFPISTIKPIPFHRLQRLYIAAGIACYRVLDKFS